MSEKEKLTSLSAALEGEPLETNILRFQGLLEEMREKQAPLFLRRAVKKHIAMLQSHQIIKKACRK